TKVAISPENERVLVSSYSGIYQWDARTGKPRQIDVPKDAAGIPNAVAFSIKNGLALTAHDDGGVRIYEAETGRFLHTLSGPDLAYARDASFSQDGKRCLVAYGNYGKTAQIRDIETGRVLAEFRGHNSWVDTATFSPGGEHVLTGSRDRTARVWDAR